MHMPVHISYRSLPTPQAAASQPLPDGDEPMTGDLSVAGQGHSHGALQLSAHQAAALAELTRMLHGLDTHLSVHKELAEVLRPDCEAAAAAEAGVGATAGGGGEGPSPAGVGPQVGHSRGQVLHPHQVDGAALAAEVAAAAAQGAGAVGGGGRQQQHHPFRPDQLLAAFSAFSQVLGAVAPNLTQLAMAGEDAGEARACAARVDEGGPRGGVARQQRDGISLPSRRRATCLEGEPLLRLMSKEWVLSKLSCVSPGLVRFHLLQARPRCCSPQRAPPATPRMCCTRCRCAEGQRTVTLHTRVLPRIYRTAAPWS